jgi:hypothetical protein
VISQAVGETMRYQRDVADAEAHGVSALRKHPTRALQHDMASGARKRREAHPPFPVPAGA